MKKVLYFLAFLVKGWEVSLLLVLPLMQTQGLINIFELGFLATIFSLFQILSSFFAGHMAAKIGSKNSMSLSLCFYALAWSGMLVHPNFISLIPFFCFGGLGSGFFIPIANSTVAQLTDKNRAKEFGDFAAFTDLGRVVLSGVTALLVGKFGLIFVSLHLFVALGALISLMVLKIINTKVHDESDELEHVSLKSFLKAKTFMLALSVGVLDVFASSSLYIFIPLLLIPKGVDITSIGILNGLFFVGYLFGRLFIGRFADRFGPVKVLMICEILMAVFIVCLIFVSNLMLASVILFMLGIFTRGTSPVIRAMIATVAGEKHRFDKAFSLYSFSANIAQVSSRSVYGGVAGSMGISSVFYFSGIIALLTLLPIYLYNRYR